MKETVESILIAFILAFIFRGFVVEAFVIPTGSMAPTLYGAHMRLRCPDCGYTWDVNFHSTSGDETDIPSRAPRLISYHCPNCGYALPASSTGVSVANIEPVRFGDRILVLKYLYLLHDPTRWDVVVFKAPDPRRRPLAGQLPFDPTDPDYPENYIKRLAGLPNESLVILDGAVYCAPGNHDLKLLDDGRVQDADLFKIQRRPAYAQERLWRTVCNNDYLPQLDRAADPLQSSWRQPWSNEGAAAWQLTDGVGRPSRTFRFDDPQRSGVVAFNPSANPDVHALTDWLGYDEYDQQWLHWSGIDVSDLKLSCFYTRQSGDGAMMFQLIKRNDVFTARLTRGRAALYHGRRGEDRAKDSLVGGRLFDVPQLSMGRPVQVELSNVDYRVTLKLDGKVVVQTSDADYSPDVAALFREAESRDTGSRGEARLIAEQQKCLVDHLSLARNVYYLNRSHWASPDNIIHLGPGEYFVLGDNSFISGDARTWTEAVQLPGEGLPYVEAGRVPKQFMLGKAFFVYWPAGYQPTRLVPYNIVPDFGEMRFIH